MTMWNNKAFTENELSLFGKLAVLILLVIPVLYTTVINLLKGEAENPFAFMICILGFVLFAISKITLFKKGVFISFGTKGLTENMANLYRIGYWLMAVGLIFTFSN